MQIIIDNLGKKFGSEWIFRDLSYEVAEGEKLVILGGNGSGKSTLLQVVSGFVTPSEGQARYKLAGKDIHPDRLKDHVAFASPYLQLIDDFTLEEMVEHVAVFKPFIKKFSGAEIIDLMELGQAKNKFIRQFSSGMRQRLKLGLAILSDTPLLLLDEPVSNLDHNAIDWYKKMIASYTSQRTVIVCSNNIDAEYYFCTKHLNVADFKTKKQRV
jgi:ABC-type multidrug transport system ATPase subunit